MNRMNEPMNQEMVNVLVMDVLDELERLFEMKNKEYGSEDGLFNFTTGGQLLRPYDDVCVSRYEALKGYAAKHIAQVYNFNIDEKDTRTNWRDIAVYAVLAIVMQAKYRDDLEIQKRSTDKY